MSDDLKIKKEAIRAEAKRARSLLSLNADEQESLCSNFFDHIDIGKNTVIGAYYPTNRELDPVLLVDSLIDKDMKVSLPVIEKDSRILKFANWHNGIELDCGKHDIPHPIIDDNTQWLEPDIFLIPLLAFDQQGYRLGYGGGYYDATLDYYRQKKDITAIGLAYAKQACLFNLPSEEHDIKMDWIITEQKALRF